MFERWLTLLRGRIHRAWCDATRLCCLDATARLLCRPWSPELPKGSRGSGLTNIHKLGLREAEGQVSQTYISSAGHVTGFILNPNPCMFVRPDPRSFYGKRVKLVELVNFARKLGWEMPTKLVQLATRPSTAEVAEPASDEPSGVATLPKDAELSSAEAATKTEVAAFGPIENETRSHVDTACAAYWLNRKPQTLRSWASKENGPIRPSRVNDRLAWAVADIKRLLAK